MVPSLCGVNNRGEPVTAGLLYGDARGRYSTPGATRGVIEVPTTGLGEVAGFAGWIAAQPEVAALWPAQAVANHALCGVGAIDTATAMTMTPLFGLTGWDAEVLEMLGVKPSQPPSRARGKPRYRATPLEGQLRSSERPRLSRVARLMRWRNRPWPTLTPSVMCWWSVALP